MKSLSIGAAWLEASAFLQRESALLLPVALLFFAVPLVLVFQSIPPELQQMAASSAAEPPEIPLYTALTLVLCGLVMIAGTLALYALALKPGISVGEALALGLRRLPVSLAATLLMGLVVAVPVALLSGISPALGSLGMLVLAFLFSARMLMLNPRIVDRPVRAVQAVRESWLLARGAMPRLLLYVAAISFPIMLAETVGRVVLGFLGLALGGVELGRAMGDVGAAVVLALGQMVMIVMTARLYRQLARRADR